MVKFKQILKIILCIFAISTIIFHSTTSIRGAQEGIKLCIYTILPALFPYCVLSIWLRSMLSNQNSKYMRPFEKFINLPSGCGLIFLLGLLGGYPIGAICVDQEQKNGRISTITANYLRPICNNAGPSFVIGIISASFDNRYYPYYLLLIQALSSILLCIIFLVPSKGNYLPHNTKEITFNNAVKQAISYMVNICATVIIFRVILSIINYYTLGTFPNEWITIINGLIELTNGVISLKNIQNTAIRFVIASGLISFGGLCVHIQTASLSSPGTYKYYLLCSIIKSVINILFALIYITCNSIYKILVIYLFTLVILKITKCLLHKKVVAIPEKMMYNTPIK